MYDKKPIDAAIYALTIMAVYDTMKISSQLAIFTEFVIVCLHAGVVYVLCSIVGGRVAECQTN